MEESDPDIEAEYQAELKKIKLKRARRKARQDVRRHKWEKFRETDAFGWCVILFFVALLLALGKIFE